MISAFGNRIIQTYLVFFFPNCLYHEQEFLFFSTSHHEITTSISPNNFSLLVPLISLTKTTTTSGPPSAAAPRPPRRRPAPNDPFRDHFRSSKLVQLVKFFKHFGRNNRGGAWPAGQLVIAVFCQGRKLKITTWNSSNNLKLNEDKL